MIARRVRIAHRFVPVSPFRTILDLGSGRPILRARVVRCERCSTERLEEAAP